MSTVAATTDAAAAPVPLSRNRSFICLMIGRFVSRAGDALISLAAVWLVLDLTGGRPLSAATAGVFEFVPFLLFGLIAGVFVDRWDRRWTMFATDLLRGLVLLIVPLLSATDNLRVWHVYSLIFVISSLTRLFNPARQAMLPDVIEEQQLVRGNAISEGANQVAWVLGASAGGFLVATLGAANVYYVDAATFVLSALTMLFVRVRPQPRAPKRLRIVADIREGFSHVRRTPALTAILLVSLVGTVSFAPVPALLSVLVRNELGGTSRMVGLLMSAFFIGSVVGSTLLAKAGERLHRGRWLLLGMVGLGVMALGLALSPVAVIAGAALALLGGAAAAINVAEFSLLQSGTPSHLRGRVVALANVSSQMLRPLALIVAGLIAERAGVRWALGLMALAAIVTGVVAVQRSSLRSAK